MSDSEACNTGVAKKVGIFFIFLIILVFLIIGIVYLVNWYSNNGNPGENGSGDNPEDFNNEDVDDLPSDRVVLEDDILLPAEEVVVEEGSFV